jgi:hypothetical protein
VDWDGEAYVVALPDGSRVTELAGLTARRRVGGSV